MAIHGFQNELLQKSRKILPHIILVGSTSVYLIVGAIVFYCIEMPYELEEKRQTVEEIRDMQMNYLEQIWDLGVELGASEEEWEQNATAGLNQLIEATMGVFDNTYLTDTELNLPKDKFDTITSEWTLASALSFTTVCLTTVGYGNVVPKTRFGQVFCIAYAMFGIPLALVTIADVGKFVGQAIIASYNRTKEFLIQTGSRFKKKRPTRRKQSKHQEEDKINLTDAESGLGMISSNHHDFSVDVIEHSNDNNMDSPKETDPLNAAGGGGLDAFEFEEPQLPVPGPFILAVLLSYTALGAIFYAFSETWSPMDGFYFCFITMTTIGFGDLVPARENLETHILLVTIVYIVLGLVLTTMTVDMVGSHYIKKMHYMGRKLEDAKAALALLKGGNMGELLGDLKVLQKKYGLSDADMEKILMNADTMFTVPPITEREIRPFLPSDVSFMSWIDRTEDGSSVSFCGFTRFSPLSRHIGRVPEVRDFERRDGKPRLTKEEIAEAIAEKDEDKNNNEEKIGNDEDEEHEQ